MCRRAPWRADSLCPSAGVGFGGLAAELRGPVFASASPSRLPSASVAWATLPAGLETPAAEVEATPLYSIIV